MAEIPLPIAHFSLMPQIGYRDLSSTFITKPFHNEFAYDVKSSGIFQVYRQRNFATNVKSISLDALFAWKPIGQFHISAGAGVALLLHHTYNQTEKLLTPDAVYTETLLSTRDVSSGIFEARTF